MAKKQQSSAVPKSDAAAAGKKKHTGKHTAAMREQERQARRAAWNSQAGQPEEEMTQSPAEPEVEREVPVAADLENAETAAPEISGLQMEEPPQEPVAAEAIPEAEELPAGQPEAVAELSEEPALPEAVAAWAPLEPEIPEEPRALEPEPAASTEAAAASPAPEMPEETPGMQEPAGRPLEQAAQAEASPREPVHQAAERPMEKKKAARAPQEKKRRKKHYFATYVAIFTMLVVMVSAVSIVVMFSTSGNSLFSTTPDVELPNFNNLTRAEVEKDPNYSKFHLIFEEVYNDEKTAGVIFDQSPKAPKQVKENASITLRVSKGVHKVTVPDVVGWKKDTVREKLKSLDLSILIKTEVNKDRAANTVLRTEPKAGATLTAGETVTVYVAAESHDENRVNVPNCVGMSRDKAVKLIGNIGLVAQTRTVASGMPAGTVVSQTPSKALAVRRGQTVMLSISSGGGDQLTGGQEAQLGQHLYPGGPMVGYGDGEVVPGSVSGHIHTWTAPDANGNQVCTVCAATRHVS